MRPCVWLGRMKDHETTDDPRVEVPVAHSVFTSAWMTVVCSAWDDICQLSAVGYLPLLVPSAPLFLFKETNNGWCYVSLHLRRQPFDTDQVVLGFTSSQEQVGSGLVNLTPHG